MQAPYRDELHVPRPVALAAILACSTRSGQAGGARSSWSKPSLTRAGGRSSRPLGLGGGRRSLALAALGGLLLLAPESEPLLAAAAVLALLLLHEALALAEGTRHALAFTSGLLFGAAANGVALFSLHPLLSRFAQVGPRLALLLSLAIWLLQGLPYGLAALAASWGAACGVPRQLARASSFTAVVALCPQLFPWQVAATQLAFVPLVQIADIGGETLVTLLLFSFTAALHAALRGSGRQRRGALCLALATLAVPLSYGVVRQAQVERLRAAAERLPVGVVQSNVSIDHKPDAAHARAILRELREMTHTLEQRGALLTLWGETAYPYPLLRAERHAPRDERRPLGLGVRGPLLFGLETYAGLEESAYKFNSASLLRPDGSFGDRVDKARLLPFAEYVPLWHQLGWLRTRFHHPGFRGGRGGAVRTRWGKLGVLICYEDLFAGRARWSVQQGARALLNLTNDAWFGDGREPRLHELAARMRAIEQRRDLVRAVNSGVSSFTSASGRSLLRTRPLTRASFIAEVRLLDLQTFFHWAGDWVPLMCVFVWCGASLRSRVTAAR